MANGAGKMRILIASPFCLPESGGIQSETGPRLWRWLAGLCAVYLLGVSPYAVRAYRFWPGRWVLAHISGDVGRFWGPPRAAEFSWERAVGEYNRILTEAVSHSHGPNGEAPAQGRTGRG